MKGAIIEQAAEDPDFQSVRMLLVDNNPHIRRLLKTVLEHYGAWNLIEAPDGREALSRLRDRPVDLMISGWTMMPMGGLELTRHIRCAKNSPAPALPILLMAGRAEKAAAAPLARQAGATLLLEKPLFTHTLIAAVSLVLARAGKREATPVGLWPSYPLMAEKRLALGLATI